MTATATVKGQQQTILVDSKGMTLYYYTPDKGGKITCTGSCLAAWPPLIAGDPNSLTAGSGVTGKLTVADNPDGKGKQVLYNNWPLYYWIRDKNPGDTTGEGVGGVWFVVPPDLAAG
jgi:predicted lipoprotein with Yx(FWY)xxD motif